MSVSGLLSQSATKSKGRKQQKGIVSRVWRLEVGNQGVGRAMLPQKRVGEDHSLPLLASDHCQQLCAFLGLHGHGSRLRPLAHVAVLPSVSLSVSPLLRIPVILAEGPP